MDSTTSIDNINELLLSANKLSTPPFNESFVISEKKLTENNIMQNIGLDTMSDNISDNIKNELLKINEDHYKNYNDLLNSYNIINEINVELKEKQHLCIHHIKYLLDIQNEANKLFLELSKKKFN